MAAKYETTPLIHLRLGLSARSRCEARISVFASPLTLMAGPIRTLQQSLPQTIFPRDPSHSRTESTSEGPLRKLWNGSAGDDRCWDVSRMKGSGAHERHPSNIVKVKRPLGLSVTRAKTDESKRRWPLCITTLRTCYNAGYIVLNLFSTVTLFLTVAMHLFTTR